ncbi:adenylate cyclase type 3-like [Lineus longissimus]|uniref:adenylate cyclase type 3-like n=1 Tax=Lineus longissimus TaxID=88925 RepID=UPI00315D7E29
MTRSYDLMHKYETEMKNGNKVSPAPGVMGSDEDTDQHPGDKNTTEPELCRKGINALLPNFLRGKFADQQLELLYQAYVRREKRDALRMLFGYALVFNLTAFILVIRSIAISQEVKVKEIILAAIMAISLVRLLAKCLVTSSRSFTAKLSAFLTMTTWFLLCVDICLYIGLRNISISPEDGGEWCLVQIYLTFVVTPLQLRWSIVGSTLFYLVILIEGGVIAVLQNYGVYYIANQIGADILLFICAQILGTISFLLMDKKQRKAFLETKGSLSVKVLIEQESKVQERLLLSVLPKHVADEVLKDMGRTIDTQFRKIYMSRHENVSILFADIVGFTEISSKLSAAQLVQILNELFASFDGLADKYHQLRIKILGDCYYCISGAPVPREDHAVLSIHMGLCMVEAISGIRERTKSGVNMRVGIHTGAVLGGVMGQKQWQFDVLGKEVTLANKMESGGIPGRVHISEVTSSFLKGEFELENGDGESREEAIKKAGIKTYLIKSVIKYYPEGTLDTKGSRPNSTAGSLADILQNGKLSVSKVEKVSRDSDASMDINQRLLQALSDKEDTSQIFNLVNPFTLMFRDKELEWQYNSNTDWQLSAAMFGCSTVLLFSLFAQICILPITVQCISAYIVGFVILCIMTLISAGAAFPSVYPRPLVQFSEWLERTSWFRSIWIICTTLIATTSQLIDMSGCSLSTEFPPNKTDLDPKSPYCDYPHYFTHFLVLTMVAVAVFLQISYLIRALLMVAMTTAFCLIATVVMSGMYDRLDSWLFSVTKIGETVISKYNTVASVVAIGVAFININRREECTVRKLFLWKREVEEQSEKVTTFRQKNENLVHNILPTHVAQNFLGANKKDEEMYSQSYDEVGVMFAACPNYNDFYTEDSFNNNGLECLRFLNEIISDYDELLNEPRFKSIIKIKTIGPTYMAASGMTQCSSKSKDSKHRWHHLVELVEFALALRETLEKINSQSFNNFILRIGINQGPIVAGVIGARKPHYDIWGNAVNVASRMESTGKSGHIQVVEETMIILQEFGYKFEKRGLVKVKGKGELVTYFLVGKEELIHDMPNQVTHL